MSRAGALLIALLLVVLGGGIILQAFGYHALFQGVRVADWAFGLVGLAFLSGGLWLLAKLFAMGTEIAAMLGGTVGLSLLGVFHYVLYQQGILGWIAIGVVDLIVFACFIEWAKSLRRAAEKKKARARARAFSEGSNS